MRAPHESPGPVKTPGLLSPSPRLLLSIVMSRRAHPLQRRLCGLFAGLAAASVFAGCGGTVEFGVDRLDGAVADAAAAPDAGMARPDAGACTPRARPAIPAAWPYPQTAASYQANFLDVIPGSAGCTIAACHGGAAPPFIASAAQAAVPADLTRATQQLWLRSLAPAGGVSLLVSKHDPNGGAQPPPYTPQQLQAIRTFIERAYDCAWKNAPAPGPGECPAPDVSYCDR